jgi:hypothetical protein
VHFLTDLALAEGPFPSIPKGELAVTATYCTPSPVGRSVMSRLRALRFRRLESRDRAKIVVAVPLAPQTLKRSGDQSGV